LAAFLFFSHQIFVSRGRAKLSTIHRAHSRTSPIFRSLAIVKVHPREVQASNLDESPQFCPISSGGALAALPALSLLAPPATRQPGVVSPRQRQR
jgi:hypothetical protein